MQVRPNTCQDPRFIGTNSMWIIYNWWNQGPAWLDLGISICGWRGSYNIDYSWLNNSNIWEKKSVWTSSFLPMLDLT